MRGTSTSVVTAAFFTLAIALVAFGIPMEALASPFAGAEAKANEIETTITNLFWIGASIMIVFSGIMALGGRWPWSKFFTIAGAVFVVAVAAQIIDWLKG